MKLYEVLFMIGKIFKVYKVLDEDKETSKLKSRKYLKYKYQKCGNIKN